MQYKYNSIIGDIFICADNEALFYVGFSPVSDIAFGGNSIIEETVKQLDEYFSHKRKSFDLPLNPKGTDFQNKVWGMLSTIPYGKTCSYKDIAIKIGNKNACRAVGNANNKNRICIIIPCHRVIGVNKKLVGYNGGLDIKQKLLDLEKSIY